MAAAVKGLIAKEKSSPRFSSETRGKLSRGELVFVEVLRGRELRRTLDSCGAVAVIGTAQPPFFLVTQSRDRQ